MNEPDLFAPLAYPQAPGARKAATSRAAADFIAPRAKSLREQVVDLLKDAALTPDEAAAKLGKSVLSIRPGFSEAVELGLIIDTGKTRANASSGLQARVYRAVHPPP